MNREICKNCKWFESEDADGFDGYCLRYPRAVIKDARDRCGEFGEEMNKQSKIIEDREQEINAVMSI